MARPKVGDDFRTLAMGRVVANLSQFDPLILEVTPLTVRTRMHFGRNPSLAGFGGSSWLGVVARYAVVLALGRCSSTPGLLSVCQIARIPLALQPA